MGEFHSHPFNSIFPRLIEICGQSLAIFSLNVRAVGGVMTSGGVVSGPDGALVPHLSMGSILIESQGGRLRVRTCIVPW